MNELDEFLEWVDTRLYDAEVALHNGDAGPRKEIWSTTDPVTVLGAWMSAVGPQEVGALFSDLERAFSGCASFRTELVAADVRGDLAYTVGHEHTAAIVDGEPRQYTLRVTQIFRREDGGWKVVHRHADTVATIATTR
jgi:ketosteroid isomerase-like protein